MVKKFIGIKNIFKTILFLNVGEVFFPPHPFHLHEACYIPISENIQISTSN